MSKKVFYTDLPYLIKIKSIFVMVDTVIIHIYFMILSIMLGMMLILCYRIRRNNNIFNLAIYWILVQGMVFASLLKEIILISNFLISLFIKYGLIVVYEKCYLKYFKKQNKDKNNDDAEFIPLSSIDIQD